MADEAAGVVSYSEGTDSQGRRYAKMRCFAGGLYYQDGPFCMVGTKRSDGSYHFTCQSTASRTFGDIAEEFRAKHGPMPKEYVPSWEGNLVKR